MYVKSRNMERKRNMEKCSNIADIKYDMINIKISKIDV